MEEDRGVVWGDTWHGLPQYVQQEAPVSIQQATDVLNYPIETRPLFTVDAAGVPRQVQACCVVRTDTGRVLVPHTGVRFTPMNNAVLLRTMEARLLNSNPDLKIESVGTLFGGATAFINVVLERYHIKGDDSETLTRLMYYNPLGIGGYKVGMHNVRIVCNNTLRMASAQAQANKTLVMIPHTENAATRVSDQLFDMSLVLVEAQGFRKSVESLVDVPIRTTEELDRLLALLFPEPEQDEPEHDTKEEVRSAQRKNQEAVRKLYDAGIEGVAPQYQRTRYALLQACTQMIDHPETIRQNNDLAFVQWDGIVGDRASNKDHILTILLTA